MITLHRNETALSHFGIGGFSNDCTDCQSSSSFLFLNFFPQRFPESLYSFPNLSSGRPSVKPLFSFPTTNVTSPTSLMFHEDASALMETRAGRAAKAVGLFWDIRCEDRDTLFISKVRMVLTTSGLLKGLKV